MLAVVGIISVVASLAGGAIGRTGSSNLGAGARNLANLLTVARSEAISRHAVVRFVVEQPAPGAQPALRRASLWAWHADAGMFVPIGRWEQLPDGVLLEPGLPDYVRAGGYAQKEPSLAKGDAVLELGNETAEATFSSAQEDVNGRYIEFMPSGNVRVPGGKTRRAIFVATQGYFAGEHASTMTYAERRGEHPTNWAQINVDTLTGRTRVYQP